MRKYMKARMCKHSRISLNVINLVTDACPNKTAYLDELVVEKRVCHNCEHFEVKPGRVPQQGRED